MKAVILAAGVGSRLAPLTDHQPKAMIAINGEPLLLHQINGLLEAGVSVEDILVVTGHAAEVVRQTVPAGVTCLHNPEFASRNNIHSFWMLRDLEEDFLLINSDVYFPRSLFREVIENAPATCLVVDAEKELADEEMKVELKRGLLRRISKRLRADLADGEYIGLAKLAREDAKVLFRKAGELLDDGQTGVWYENAIAAATDEVEIRAFKIASVPWIEIDTHEDLAQARRLLPRVEAFEQAGETAGSRAKRGGAGKPGGGPDGEIVKPSDAWYTVFLTDPIAIPLTYFIARRLPGVTPNAITAAAGALGVAAAGLFYLATPATLIAGALLYQFCFVLDCIDGKLARLTGRTSHYAAFYDLYLDQFRTMLAMAALAAGLVTQRGEDWTLMLIGMGIAFLYGFSILNLQKINLVRQAFLAGLSETSVKKSGGKKTAPADPKDNGRFWKLAVRIKSALNRRRLRLLFFSSIEIQCISLVIAPLFYPWLKPIWIAVLTLGFLQFLCLPVVFHARMRIARVAWGKGVAEPMGEDEG